MINFTNKISVVQETLKELNSVVGPVAFFFSCRSVQLGSDQGFTEESNDSQLVIGDHV